MPPRVLQLALLIWGVAVAAFLYGQAAQQHGWFPASAVNSAVGTATGLLAKAKGRRDWFYVRSPQTVDVTIKDTAAMAPGLTLITGVGPANTLIAKLVDADGHTVHKWAIDWFKIWPDPPSNVPPVALPKSRPGTLIHGALVSPDGDLTFNFEELGMVRVDACSHVKWRLARRSHHSLAVDDDGHIWTSELVWRDKPDPAQPGFTPPFDELRVLEVSPEGKALRSISLFDILRKNGLQGLLYMSATANWSPTVTGDTLHANDVEVFSRAMPSGVFQPGDVMVSLRNVSTVIVFDPTTLKVRRAIVGRFVRQHDADFASGSAVTVFDNNNMAAPASQASSRVVEVTLDPESERVIYQGTPSHPFFSDIMGKQQRLPNGGYLVTEGARGRAFEVDAQGRIVWEYFNRVEKGWVGVITEATRLSPASVSPNRLKQVANRCAA